MKNGFVVLTPVLLRSLKGSHAVMPEGHTTACYNLARQGKLQVFEHMSEAVVNALVTDSQLNTKPSAVSEMVVNVGAVDIQINLQHTRFERAILTMPAREVTDLKKHIENAPVAHTGLVECMARNPDFLYCQEHRQESLALKEHYVWTLDHGASVVPGIVTRSSLTSDGRALNAGC